MKEIVKIGLFSRIDAGGRGYRRGLVKKGFEIFEDEETHFRILLGGLVSKREINRYLKNKIKTLKEAAAKVAKETGEKPEKIDRQKVENEYLDYLANELSMAIPQLAKGKEKTPRLYIMTSPSYDGVYGETVAHKLVELRPDIRYWEKADEHFPLKRINKRLLGLVPEKESWRSEYDSTPVDREVKDHQKRTTKPLPDIYAVGCFASNIYKPAGEAKRAYLSVPALHKLEEIKTSENQIGVTVLEIYSGDELIHEKKRTYNLKDLLGKERELIPMPSRCSENQKAILSSLIERGALTIGLLEDATKIPRDKLTTALKRMEKSERFQPKIVFDKSSARYDFDPEWIQKNLTYNNCASGKDWQEDVIVGFGCPHVGSVHTDYKFFINRLPEVILEIGAKLLAGDGDLIEGLKHHLTERGEVFIGMNYTSQEMLIAHMVGEVILRVFDVRFKEGWEAFGRKELSQEELENLVQEALLTFIFRKGNHDDWTRDFGVVPLQTFRYELVRCLTRAITKTLEAKKCYLPGLNEIIESKVLDTERYTLSSGLSLEMFHLYMARAKTTTLRLQETLSKSGSQVVFLANFHVAASMARWEPNLGQRVGMQLGALVHKTEFEENKGKKLDTGFGCLRIFSKDKKIMMAEEFYVNPLNGNELDNEAILRALEQKIGIRF